MEFKPTLKNLTTPQFGKPPDDQNVLLQQLGQPHVASFNFFTNEGLDLAIENLYPVEFNLPDETRVRIVIEGASLIPPLVPTGTVGVKKQTILPAECRQRKATYRGKFTIRVGWMIDGVEQQSFDKELGDIPIMLKSNRCHLRKMTPEQLVEAGEHEQEWGGYFVVKGLERLVRMLLMTRRNYPIAIKRSGWKQRGALFSDLGISMRCVAKDQTATTNVLHFVTDGTAKLMFSHRKVLYYTPLILILKCLMDYPDRYIHLKLMEGNEDNSYYSDCIKSMLRLVHEEDLHTHEECKMHLGKMFRVRLYECPKWYTDAEITDYILEKCVLIHLDNNLDKFNMLIFMTKKLFSFAQDKCKIEGADAVMMQELLLGGHLYLQVIKEKMQGWLYTLKSTILKRANANPTFTLTPKEISLASKMAGGIQSMLEMFLATGNLSSASGLGLMQDKGLTIVAENINRMRYMSHFRAVHRGSFFQEMRTTEARQLLPDAWGFICPVHTPDGTPCGLLNHLTMHCVVTEAPNDVKCEEIRTTLLLQGMERVAELEVIDFKNSYVTHIDGRVVGYIHRKLADELVFNLRALKVQDVIPRTTEIAFVPFKKSVGQYPGIFIFTGPARMMRPLINLQLGKVELIGTFEQVYLDVAITEQEIYEGVTTHMEISQTGFLSNLAQLIPMPDCNQSPRNMYQCQMGKQTMGTACHNWNRQADTKLYRLQTPASPLFRPVHYDHIGLDDFAMGTNAIVAVISYTGYDMEDAMVINKSAYERGFAHGSIYKSEFVELEHVGSYFCRDPTNTKLDEYLDTDGLPYVGRQMEDATPWYCYFNADQSKYIVVKYKCKEDCVYLNSVRLCSDLSPKSPRIACFTFRIPRNPTVGDKFASRAGQKGICSQKWPEIDLPFSECGLVPDIVFNPHGFPSRMTIAMMIELMAGKSGAVHGLVHDATPFKFNENDTAIHYFGRMLEHAGYNYYGQETLYSGIDGRQMDAQIFFGVCHYQRLRHMVSDKWQVRSTGPVDPVTRQPIKGRKKGGGVRFGEMERDALISHGAAINLHDRLFRNSDCSTAKLCLTCQSILSPITISVSRNDKSNWNDMKETCQFCKKGDNIVDIELPHIAKFFIIQMASINIKTKIICEKI